MRKIALVHLAALLLASFCIAGVRTVRPEGDEIVLVKTKLGMTTLIYAPSPIQPSIVGDQSSFRIDLLSDFMSVKPLRFGAQTNLFVMTQKRRFNVHLQTVSGPADDIVYIREKSSGDTVSWRPLHKSSSNAELRLSIERVGSSREGFFLLDGKISAKTASRIKPETFWITQSGKSRPIEHLFISERTIPSNRPVRFGLSVAKAELDRSKAVTLELRGGTALSITVPGDALWK